MMMVFSGKANWSVFLVETIDKNIILIAFENHEQVTYNNTYNYKM